MNSVEERAERLTIFTVALALLAALVFGSLLWMIAHPRLQAPVQTPGLVQCRLPSEFEQLHIVVTLRDGKLLPECMYVGSRGTYPGGRR